MEDNLVSTGFSSLEEDPPTSRDCLVLFSAARRVGESDMVLKCRDGCIRNRKIIKEESEEMMGFQVEPVTGQIYPIWTGYV
jgi:hypothetical protein